MSIQRTSQELPGLFRTDRLLPETKQTSSSLVSVQEQPAEEAVAGNASGVDLSAAVLVASGAATGAAAAAGSVTAVTASSVSGAATGAAASSGAVQLVNAAPANGAAAGGATAPGQTATLSADLLEGAEAGGAAAGGQVVAAVAAPLSGAAGGEGSASGEAVTASVSLVIAQDRTVEGEVITASAQLIEGAASAAVIGEQVQPVSGGAGSVLYRAPKRSMPQQRPVDGSAAGVTLTTALAVVPGHVSGTVSSQAGGAVLSVASRCLSGDAAADAATSPQLTSRTLRLIAGSATAGADAKGALVSAGFSLRDPSFMAGGEATGAIVPIGRMVVEAGSAMGSDDGLRRRKAVIRDNNFLLLAA